MNTKLKNLLIIFIMIIALVFVNMPISSATINAIVNTNSVRVRKGPTTQSEMIEMAYKGEKVKVTGKDGEWYKVIYNKKEGYIRGDLLDIEDDSQVPDENSNTVDKPEDKPVEEPNHSEEPGASDVPNENVDNNQTNKSVISTIKLGQNVLKEGDKITISNDVKLKIVPTINSNNIVTISANTEVMVTEIINSWCKIETEEQSGWLRIEK